MIINRLINIKFKICTLLGSSDCGEEISTFDPLGLIAPAVLVGNQILQEICHGNDWDEPIEGEVLAKWERWRSQLPLLEQPNIPRNFQPSDFGSIATLSYIICQMRLNSDTDNVLISDWLMKTEELIVLELFMGKKLVLHRLRQSLFQDLN